MATIDARFGQIKDRTVGYKPMHYCVGSKSKKFLQTCLKAHESIMDVLTPQARKNITPKEMRAAVLAYVAMDDAGKKELIKKIALSGYGLKNDTNPTAIEELANAWYKQKVAQGVTEQQKKIVMQQKQVFLDFFAQNEIKDVTDLRPDTAHKLLAWRSEMNYGNHSGTVTTSASVLKLSLQILRQMAKIAARNGWIANQGIWDDVKVKKIAGVNIKSVEPLPISSQKSFLEKLIGMDAELHDSLLFLLLTGMKIGELETIILHGSASAAKALPICPTIAEIFARGHIFRAKKIRQITQSAWFKQQFPGIHANRLRHTFAANKLGGEDAANERKEWLEWLERSYFAHGANSTQKSSPCE